MLKREINILKDEILEEGDVFRIKSDTDIMIVSDFHFDVKKRRPKYFFEVLGYMDKLITKLKTMVNPTFISLGDLFNKDLNIDMGILYFEEVQRRFQQIHYLTKGKAFIVMGNHENTYSEISPTFLLTEISPNLRKTLEDNGRDFNRPGGHLLKTPHTIRIGRTKISLHHFRKDGMYTCKKGDNDYHIGLYHDTYITHQMEKTIGDSLPITKIWSKHMSGLSINHLDVAIFGDFHIPLPVFRVGNSKETIGIIPGSFGRNNSAVETYNSVKLPIIKVRGKNVTVNVENFLLTPYEESYNLKDKLTDTNNVNSKINKMIKNKSVFSGKVDISVNNYIDFIREVYGEEWHNKVNIELRGVDLTNGNNTKETKGD